MEGGSTFGAPRYWDAQARVPHHLKNSGFFDAIALFSDDPEAA
jgi:hypothetical protein